MRSRLILSAFLLFVLLAGACSGGPAPRVGRVAPAFTLPSLADGSPVSLDQFRGKVVLLNFFATWCPTCRAEAPILQAAWEELQPEGVAFLVVAIGEEGPDEVTRFMKESAPTLPVLMNQTGEMLRLYNVNAIPTTFILDREGVVRSINVGSFASKDAILERVRAVAK